jgi:hypothetical protein
MPTGGKYILKYVFNFLSWEHSEPGKVGNKRWARRFIGHKHRLICVIWY